MNLKGVIIQVYNTSKSEACKTIEGNFELTGTERNNRLQINDIDTQKRYWIDQETLNGPIMKIVQEVKPLPIMTVQFPTYYTVSRGDTITTIANKFDTTEVCINALNGSNSFAVGQKIRVK